MITHPAQRHQPHFAITWLILIQTQILILPELELKNLQSYSNFEIFSTIIEDSKAKCVFLKIEQQDPMLNRVKG